MQSETDNKAVREFMECLGDKLTTGTISGGPLKVSSLKRALGVVLHTCEQDEDDKIKRSAKMARVALDRKLGKLDEEDASRRTSRDRQNLQVLVDDVNILADRFRDAENSNGVLCGLIASDHLVAAQSRLKDVIESAVPKTSARFEYANKAVDEILIFGKEKWLAAKKSKDSGAEPDPGMEAWLKTLRAKKDAQLFDKLAHLLFGATD
jgi:hypothetical protein